MKKIINELCGEELKEFRRLSPKERVYMVYFTLSFCSLAISDETPLLIAALVVLNFCNASRLVKKIKFNEDTNANEKRQKHAADQNSR